MNPWRSIPYEAIMFGSVAYINCCYAYGDISLVENICYSMLIFCSPIIIDLFWPKVVRLKSNLIKNYKDYLNRTVNSEYKSDDSKTVYLKTYIEKIDK